MKRQAKKQAILKQSLWKKVMQAIEFETYLENGLIHYQHWQEGKHVKVIVLGDESVGVRVEQQNQRSINRHAGKISLTQEPLEFQKNI